MLYKVSAVSKGIGIGTAFHFSPYNPVIATNTVDKSLVKAEIERFNLGQELAKNELDDIMINLALLHPDKAAIFTAQLDILFDIAIKEDVLEKITDECYSASFAIESVFDYYIGKLSKSSNELIAQRAADLEDVKERLLRCLSGEKDQNLASLTTPVIVIAQNLLPSHTATLNKEMVLGIVSEVGGDTSHTAIIAKSYEIPATLGLGDVFSKIPHGATIIVDGVGGQVIVEPTPEELAHYAEQQVVLNNKYKNSLNFLSYPSATKDGRPIHLGININAVEPDGLNANNVCDGVGLFRTEFIYMNRNSLPTEQEQYEIYKTVLSTFDEKPVTLRTLDVSVDKNLSYLPLPQEDNPLLGIRSLRFCFAHPGIFNTQLRAALRASVYGNLRIMFPMVSSIEDVRQAKDALHAAMSQLDAQNIPYDHNVKVGIMIETPAIATMVRDAAEEVDFVSIGSNDLTQYITAADRLSASLVPYCQKYHPAVFRTIADIICQCNYVGVSVSLCGELASDPLAIPALLGLGLSKFSIRPTSIAEVKQIFSKIALQDATHIAQKVLKLKTSAEIEAYLQEVDEKYMST